MIGPALPAILRELKRRTLLAAAQFWIWAHPEAAARIRLERAWLFGAAAGRSYGDNSAALFKHVRRNRPDISAYWVIDADSPAAAAAQADGPVLDRNSVAAYVRGLLAAVHVVSHGVYDTAGLTGRQCRALRVRLGHGITAAKVRKRSTTPGAEAATQRFDLVPVSSEFEKRNKMTWGIEESRIAITGIARFDPLVAKQAMMPAEFRKLLYMPTWRDGTTKSRASFSRSEYASALREVLTSPEIRALLERFDASLQVVFHPIARPFAQQLLGELGSERIAISDTPDLQETIATCGAYLTDYSSVCWDFLYLDKPVIFYQFDRVTFERERGSHLGNADAWPGPVAVDLQALIELLAAYLEGRWSEVEPTQRVNEWKRTIFAFRDARNCERILAEIESRLGKTDATASPETEDR